jgi:hypothetical protein
MALVSVLGWYEFAGFLADYLLRRIIHINVISTDIYKI